MLRPTGFMAFQATNAEQWAVLRPGFSWNRLVSRCVTMCRTPLSKDVRNHRLAEFAVERTQHAQSLTLAYCSGRAGLHLAPGTAAASPSEWFEACSAQGRRSPWALQ